MIYSKSINQMTKDDIISLQQHRELLITRNKLLLDEYHDIASISRIKELNEYLIGRVHYLKNDDEN